MAGKRRNNGEGAAPYERADGRWCAHAVIGWKLDGKPIRKTVYGATRKECADRLADLITMHRTTGVPGGRSPKLADWMRHWLDAIAAPRVGEQTMLGYRSKVRLYILQHPSGQVRLDKLSPDHVEAIYTTMRRKPPKGDSSGRKGKASETTILQVHRILSRALKDAHQRGKITTNPASMLDAPRAAEFDPDVLGVDDARRLIRQATNTIPAGGARWLVGLALGPRQGEVLGMGWDQLDLAAGTIKFTRELYRLPWEHGCTPAAGGASCGRRAASCPGRHGGGLHIGTPKSQAGKRSLVLPQPLIEALRDHRDVQKAVAVQEGGREVWTSQNDQQVDLVFCQRNGRPIDARRDYDAWHAFLGAADVPEVRVHDGRHTAATLLLLMGVDGRVVMDMLGWSQMSMLKRYQHVLDEMKHDAAARMATALWTDPDPDPTPGDIVSLTDFRKRRKA